MDRCHTARQARGGAGAGTLLWLNQRIADALYPALSPVRPVAGERT